MKTMKLKLAGLFTGVAAFGGAAFAIGAPPFSSCALAGDCPSYCQCIFVDGLPVFCSHEDCFECRE